MNFLTCLKGEYLKTKGTFTFWLVLLGGLLIPTISFLIQLNKPEFFVGRAASPWLPFFGDSMGTAIPVLFPFFIILIIALNFSQENKANAWKKLFVTPYHRSVLFFSKLTFILCQIIFSLFIFVASMCLFGMLLGVIHPELNFLNITIDFKWLLKSIAKIFIAFLALIGFQFTISFYFKNFVVPVGVGLFGFILGMMLLKWEYSIYNFLSNNLHVSNHIGSKVVSDFTLNLPTYQFFSIIYFVIFITIGWVLFNRKAL